MNVAIKTAGMGFVVPAAIAMAIGFLLPRLWKVGASQRYAAAVAFAVAYCAGFALVSPEVVAPARHWHWTFYLAIVAAVVGPISLASGIHVVERWLLFLLAAMFAAWLLVPTWANLQPPRMFWLPLLTCYLFVVAAALDPLPRFVPPTNLLGFMMLTAAGNAAMIAALVSVTYGLLAGIAAAALAGCGAASFFSGGASQPRGVSLAYAVIIGGWAFIGCIEPEHPVAGLMLVPSAPAALWCCAWGPLARCRGMKAIAVQTAAVSTILAIAAWLALG